MYFHTLLCIACLALGSSSLEVISKGGDNVDIARRSHKHNHDEYDDYGGRHDRHKHRHRHSRGRKHRSHKSKDYVEGGYNDMEYGGDEDYGGGQGSYGGQGNYGDTEPSRLNNEDVNANNQENNEENETITAKVEDNSTKGADNCDKTTTQATENPDCETTTRKEVKSTKKEEEQTKKEENNSKSKEDDDKRDRTSKEKKHDIISDVDVEDIVRKVKKSILDDIKKIGYEYLVGKDEPNKKDNFIDYLHDNDTDTQADDAKSVVEETEKENDNIKRTINKKYNSGFLRQIDKRNSNNDKIKKYLLDSLKREQKKINDSVRNLKRIKDNYKEVSYLKKVPQNYGNVNRLKKIRNPYEDLKLNEEIENNNQDDPLKIRNYYEDLNERDSYNNEPREHFEDYEQNEGIIEDDSIRYNRKEVDAPRRPNNFQAHKTVVKGRIKPNALVKEVAPNIDGTAGDVIVIDRKENRDVETGNFKMADMNWEYDEEGNLKEDSTGVIKNTKVPTKKIFTMSSPNYYDKLPRIAEKYDFNEPLPEQDRVQVKPALSNLVPNTIIRINGKPVKDNVVK